MLQEVLRAFDIALYCSWAVLTIATPASSCCGFCWGHPYKYFRRCFFVLYFIWTCMYMHLYPYTSIDCSCSTHIDHNVNIPGSPRNVTEVNCTCTCKLHVFWVLSTLMEYPAIELCTFSTQNMVCLHFILWGLAYNKNKKFGTPCAHVCSLCERICKGCVWLLRSGDISHVRRNTHAKRQECVCTLLRTKSIKNAWWHL